MLRVIGNALGAVVAMALHSAPTLAQNNAYPDRPIRLVVPFAAGGGGDGAARPLAQAMSAKLGQQVVIDNRGGAGGVIGVEIVAHSVADGYTLLMSTAGFAAMPALHKKLPFDPVKDFAGIVVAESGS